jgi:CTD kinase subunit alpha
MEIDEPAPAAPAPGLKQSGKWSPNKWSRWSPTKEPTASAGASASVSTAAVLLASATYVHRLADKERQYDQHLSSVAPYVSAAFSQWYAQDTKPNLPEFLVHYFGRRPSNFELDQVNALLKRRTQLSCDQVELRNLYEQALKLESEAAAAEAAQTAVTAVATAKAPARAAPGEAYERIVQVGEGTYGKVYKARSVNTGVLVALKRIRMEQEKDGFPVTSMREIKLLQALHHPNVVRLLEMMVSKGGFGVFISS